MLPLYLVPVVKMVFITFNRKRAYSLNVFQYLMIFAIQYLYLTEP